MLNYQVQSEVDAGFSSSRRNGYRLRGPDGQDPGRLLSQLERALSRLEHEQERLHDSITVLDIVEGIANRIGNGTGVPDAFETYETVATLGHTVRLQPITADEVQVAEEAQAAGEAERDGEDRTRAEMLKTLDLEVADIPAVSNAGNGKPRNGKPTLGETIETLRAKMHHKEELPAKDSSLFRLVKLCLLVKN